MNYLALFSNEYETKSVIVTGARVLHLKKVHSAQIGKEYDLACIGKGLARGKIESITNDQVVISRSAIQTSELSSNVTLVIGCPRPQSIKKILALAVAYGVKKVIFCASENTEKSYLSSKILQFPELQQQILIEAVEQSGQVYLPHIHCWTSFSDFKRSFTQANEDCMYLLADIEGSQGSLSIGFDNNKELVILVGPEKGWSQQEKTYFDSLSANKIRLAPGVLRVEQAVGAVLGVVYSSFD